MNTFKKFAAATVFVALGLTAFGQLDDSSGGRGGEPSIETAAPGPGSTETLTRNPGTKPLPEIIEFWQQRSDDHPLDYLSRTELGYALTTAAAQSADLDQYAAAEEAFREALDLNQKHQPAKLGLASALIARHDFTAALEQTADVLAGNPDSLPALAFDGDARLGIGDQSGAAAAYEQLIAGERSAPTVARLARLRWATGATAEAVELAAEALRLSEDLAIRPSAKAFYHFQLGHFSFRSGRTDAAITAYREALALDPDDPGAAEELAFALASVGELEEAADLYAAMLQDGAAADLHGHYAEVLLGLGRPDEAAEQFRLGDALAAATLDEQPAERRHIAGYLATRDPEVAVDLAELDLEDRQDAGAYDTLAWALFNAGDIERADDVIDQALATGIRDAGILYHAAAINHAVGDDIAAGDLLQSALAINSDFHPTEAEAARMLQRKLG